MLNAIQTRFLGPTNFRGSRVKAYCQGDSVTVEWRHELNSAENHKRALETLIKKMDWHDWLWAAGWSADGKGAVAVALSKKDHIQSAIINYL